VKQPDDDRLSSGLLIGSEPLEGVRDRRASALTDDDKRDNADRDTGDDDGTDSDKTDTDTTDRGDGRDTKDKRDSDGRDR
jgi:hypothetical protein